MIIKNILVATDFSNTANNALQYAVKLATKYDAELSIVHAFSIEVLTARGKPVLPNPGDVEFNRQKAEEMLEKTKMLVSRESSVKINSKAICIYFQADFAEAIHGQQADLIIVGNTGLSGWKKIFLGSNAARIIQDSPVPVLAIPDNANFTPIREIGFAYDGLPFNAIDNLEIIRSFRNSFNANVHIFQIIENEQMQSPYLSELVDFLPGAQLNYVYDNVVESGILKSIELNQLDMMVMVPRQRGFFHNLVNGSITKRVAYEISVPLLVIPE